MNDVQKKTVDSMKEQKRVSPLEVGLLIVVVGYFLFTLHSLFTLQWWGEWDRLAAGSESIRFAILVEDLSAFVGLVFRFAASIIALIAIVFYITKKSLSKPAAYNLLKAILVLEAIYWLSLFATAIFDVQFAFFMGSINNSISSVLSTLLSTSIPDFIESLVFPIFLLVLAFKLSPNKPIKVQVRWGLITGTLLVAVFWLVNTNLWISTLKVKDYGYLTSYPQNLISFLVTSIGLFALVIYSAFVTMKSAKIETLQELNLRPVGVIIVGLGMFFLWNYLTWIFFGGNYVWSTWYAWFLGHNMDLWMLSLPLVGLPLLFYNKAGKKTAEIEQ
jgi:hypothetical protein